MGRLVLYGTERPSAELARRPTICWSSVRDDPRLSLITAVPRPEHGPGLGAISVATPLALQPDQMNCGVSPPAQPLAVDRHGASVLLSAWLKIVTTPQTSQRPGLEAR
jgi:hypothetical protein